MTFKEAKDKLAEMVGPDRYRALYYAQTVDRGGNEESQCRLYVDPGISCRECPSWEEAFIGLRMDMLRYEAESKAILAKTIAGATLVDPAAAPAHDVPYIAEDEVTNFN